MAIPPSPQNPRLDADFARIEALFAVLAPLAPEARHDALREITDLAIRDRVGALLAAHDRFDDAAAADGPSVSALGAGDHVGAYRLIERVGAGGMGEVFRAERADGLFAQQVAVKITRAHLSQPELLRRFSIERQILASLNHPNIVGLLDGGATSTGQAYLIMDYLEGQPLTHYARAHALSLADRVRLFSAVCAAVQHAHTHGVVHRDLKPANILVGADGVPKVVDFGIAKLLESDTGPQVTTALWPGPLTPNYASPEQLRGLPITTACDVYALGVVLYELVAGVRPYETEGLPLDRVVQVVVHDEPKRPSEAARDVPYAPARLRGDVDAIVQKAVHKLPSARYGSAGELASDLERWLNGDPVVARAPSTAYVLRRLAARHRALVATAAAALVAVVAASSVAGWQWQAARAAQIEAEQRLRDVRQLANALIFKIHDAVTPLAGSTPVRRTIVDEALKYLERLEEDAADDPPLRLELAAAHRQLGAILGNPAVPNLGDRAAAAAEYEKARALVAPLLGTHDDLDVATSVVHGNVVLATLYGGMTDNQRSVALARETLDYILDFARRHPGDERVARLVGQARFSLAIVLRDDDAIAEWERTLAHYEAMLARTPESADAQRNVALVGKYLGGALETKGDVARARVHYQRSLALDEQRLNAAPDSRSVQFDAAISYSNTASIAERVGDLAAAGPLFARSLELRRQLSETDPENVQAADRYAYLLARMSSFHLSNRDTAAAIASAEAAIAKYSELQRKRDNHVTRIGLGYGWRALGFARKESGDRRGACAAFNRAHLFYGEAKRNNLQNRDNEAESVEREVARCQQAPAADENGTY